MTYRSLDLCPPSVFSLRRCPWRRTEAPVKRAARPERPRSPADKWLANQLLPSLSLLIAQHGERLFGRSAKEIIRTFLRSLRSAFRATGTEWRHEHVRLKRLDPLLLFGSQPERGDDSRFAECPKPAN